MRARYVLAAAAVVVLAACQPTTRTHDPLRVTFTPHCNRDQGLDIVVENIGGGRVPVTVSFGDAVYDPADYATPTRWVPAGADTAWSFPGSRPEQATVRVGGAAGAGWITEDFDWVTGCVR